MRFTLRLLIAFCAAPLVAAAFVGVAYLALRVHPLYLLLVPVCVALAFVVGFHIHLHVEDEPEGSWVFASGVVLVATALAAYVIAFNFVASRHMCTVVEAHVWHQLNPGGEHTHTYRRLACDDGRTDEVGNPVAAQRGDDATDQYRGTRLLVAYDPDGRLGSHVVDDELGWQVVAGIGMVLVIAIHTGVVIGDQRRRRSERFIARQE
ncbi:hypothetical protein ACQPZF_35735 [Actinosynnema sp. CS-041913]|uniref:hypothetical protein n=1 Tax=Actinosynnema sp. CS-041913 TaxID=3239917 RepID=UPI003D8F4690